jgi:hypothetical protein
LFWGTAWLAVIIDRPYPSLFKIDHFQLPANVRFGSLADTCAATSHVRFTPNSDRESKIPQKAMSALPPKADMCGATRDVRFGPIADIAWVVDENLAPRVLGLLHRGCCARHFHWHVCGHGRSAVFADGGKELRGDTHQRTGEHKHDSRGIGHDAGPRQCFLGQYDKSNSSHRYHANCTSRNASTT